MRTIIESGNWILPLRDGLIPSKPPLMHWCAALISLLTGLTPLYACRAVSACAGLVTLLLTVVMSTRLARERTALEAGTISFIVLATSYGFVSLTTDARVDMVFTACMCWGFAWTIPELMHPSDLNLNARLDRALPIAAIGFGLAVLAKGPLGLALPALVLCAICWQQGGTALMGRLLKPRLLPILIVLAIAVPWYVLAYRVGGAAFIDRQLLFENTQRLVGGEGTNSRPWYFYFPIAVETSLPWFIIFAIFAVGSLRRVYSRNPGTIWFATGFVLLSFASGKRAAYLLPLLPGLALALGLYGSASLQRMVFASREKFLRWCHRASFLTSGLHGLLFCAMISIGSYVPGMTECLAPLFVLSLSLFICDRFINLHLPEHALEMRCLVLGVSVSCLLVIGMTAGFALKGVRRQYAQTAEQISMLAAGAPLMLVRDKSDELFDPLMYFLPDTLRIADPDQASIRGLVLARKSWAIAHCGNGTKLLSFSDDGSLERQAVLARCS